MLLKIWSLALLVIKDGLRRNALIGLILFALLLETGGLFFFDFIPRDIGRASSDFILSVGWLTGILFLFFHAVQTMAWDEERRTIHTFLARPITRSQYVLGVFFGLAFLLLLLKLILAFLGYFLLVVIKNMVNASHFSQLSTGNYILAWFGVYCIELTILSVIMLFSGMVRGGFPVLLMSVSYYFICSGMPVVRESLVQLTGTQSQSVAYLLKSLTMLFPDFGRFDFKSMITNTPGSSFSHLLTTDMLLLGSYIGLVLWCAAMIYERRDLQ